MRICFLFIVDSFGRESSSDCALCNKNPLRNERFSFLTLKYIKVLRTADFKKSLSIYAEF
jgi:hypothetical protein